VNVQLPGRLSFRCNTAHPLAAVLSGAFDVPRDEPDVLKMLLKRIDRPNAREGE